MKKKFIILAILLLLPLSVFAAVGTDIVELPNPLGNTDTVPELVANMVKGLLGITGAFALFFVIQGGFTWIMSNGNAEKVKAGKEAIKWSVLGVLAIFLSYVVVSAVFSSISGF